MGGDSTQGDLSRSHRWLDGDDEAPSEPTLGLAIAWCLASPERVGEVLRVPPGPAIVVGRAEEAPRFQRLTPSRRQHGTPLSGRLLSRHQLEVTAQADSLQLKNVGSCALKVDSKPVDAATVTVGQAFELDRQLVLVVVRRGPFPEWTGTGVFGEPDSNGIVGEGTAAWALRGRLQFLARRSEPVLIWGSSGTGKELAARALHTGSERAQRPFVARNAATLPEGLIDAELFGNARNYPNPGMADREGLIGAAHGGTLFFDEIGELPEALQAHLLRVLDQGGTYQRLGETRERRSDFRFVAATNRDPGALKHDLLARLPLRLQIPGLGERPEDIPLLLRHLLAQARSDPDLAERLFDGPYARVSPELILALLGHRWTHHVRELAELLWLAIETSPGRALVLTPQVRERLSSPDPDPASAPADPAEVSAERVQRALEASGGSVTQAARELGLSSRYTLYRLMRKYGLG